MTDDRWTPNRREVLGTAAALTTAATTAAAAAAATSGAAFAQEAPTLAGKSVLITGTSSGFGRLTSLHLARNGATVIASMRNFDEGARPEAQELAAIAAEEELPLHLVEIDVTDQGLIDAGVAQAQEIAGGKLDVLVNNAGIGIGGPVEAHDHEAAFKQFNTNLFGCHRMARAVLPAMRAQSRGHIIQVTSQLGRFTLPNIAMYCATKFGAEAMFEGMAYELAPTGVEVTIVQPGGYPTKIWENGQRYLAEVLERLDEERKAAYAQHIEMTQAFSTAPRDTDPMDVARAIEEVILAPLGEKPLRRSVHPRSEAVDAANAALAQVQAGVLGQSAYAPWHKAVTNSEG